MPEVSILDLADCTEFRQCLEARPPRIVHGTVWLLCGLLGAALAWTALTQADLVVRAPGRVRPTSPPQQVFNHARGEVLSASAGARVTEVGYREGDEVRAGQVLVRLDTSRLDAEIARREQTVAAGEAELAQGARMSELVTLQYAAARATAQAELETAEEEVSKARAQSEADLRILRVQLGAATDKEQRARLLRGRGAASEDEYLEAATHLKDVRERLDKAQQSPPEGKVKVLRQRLAAAGSDYDVRLKELDVKRAARRAEIDAAKKELDMLKQERDRAVLLAPRDGVVTTPEVKAGDLLPPGKEVLEVADGDGFRFEAAVPSEEVGNLRVGMPVRVKLDAFDYQRYGTVAGTICAISADSRVPQNGSAVLYVVTIALESDEGGRGEFRGRVKLGMAGQAEIITGRETLLSLLVKKLRQTISLG
jgi:multidrug efflux pump subunit AcrA (membrane-fusion protein)